jgi:hypothetical protein
VRLEEEEEEEEEVAVGYIALSVNALTRFS